MTIAEQLKQISERLAPWAQSVGGRVEIANDPVHAFSILQAKPGAPTAVVQFHDEEKRGEYEEASMVDRTFHVIIYRSAGMKLGKGESLVAGTAGGRALYDLAEEVRELVRGISFDETTEVTPDYRRTQPYTFQDVTFDALQIEFTIGCQLPPVDLYRNPTQPNPETETRTQGTPQTLI